MNSVAIYMEGGGNGVATKDSLRRGMDLFLAEAKEQTRANFWRWKLVCCGSRNDAFRMFQAAYRNSKDTIVILLVDSESRLTSSPKEHLEKNDGWPMKEFDCQKVHLMVQMMEAWLVSDPDGLARYYGKNFNLNALPKRRNLEEEAIRDIDDALARATRGTKKGKYHKIRHASDLLGNIDPTLARTRCPNCERLFMCLKRMITAS